MPHNTAKESGDENLVSTRLGGTTNFRGRTALVVGASRGFGRGVVETLLAKEMIVTAVARNREDLEGLARKTPAKIIVADATGEQAAERILSETKPNLLVLSAGASLDLRPLQEHTWETFSRPWEVDTKLTFLWVRAVLRSKEGPEHVVVFGSGAALFGSPLSGGYAGAKKMNSFIAQDATRFASRAKRPIKFHCLIPPLSPQTDFGAAAARAYAKMSGLTFEDFVKQLPSHPSPADIGAAVVALHEDPERWNQVSYRISAEGLAPVE